jgi:hypothetical protein
MRGKWHVWQWQNGSGSAAGSTSKLSELYSPLSFATSCSFKGETYRVRPPKLRLSTVAVSPARTGSGHLELPPKPHSARPECPGFV